MFIKSTPWSEFISDIKRRTACSEAVVWSEEYSDLTCEQAMTKYRDDKNSEESWGVWCIMFYHDYLEADLIKIVMGKITNEMTAFQMYIEMDNLSDEEDAILEGKFKGKIPTAEDELKNGIITRKKK